MHFEGGNATWHGLSSAEIEIGRRGLEIYERQLRQTVETAGNIGKMISIDVQSGDYEIDEDLIKAGDRLLARHPDTAIFGTRIEYDAAFAIGSSLTSSSVHRATIVWNGVVLNAAVLALGDRPLLGTALLDGHNLSIDFVAGGAVRIRPYP